MKRAEAVLLATVLTALLLTGCYDDKEIDETGYIIAVGIDKAADGDYKYTFQFSAPLATTEGGGGGKAPEDDGEDEGDEDEDIIADAGNSGVNNVIVKAPDFYVAKNMLNNFLSKNVNMSHLKLIVFSPDMDRAGFLRHSQLLRREREVRPHTSLAVAQKSAEEFIRCVNPELEANTAKYYELMSLQSNNIYAPEKKLRDFADESDTMGGDSVLPVACIAKYDRSADFAPSEDTGEAWVKATDGARISDSKSELRGMAVFKNRELCGVMDGDSALVYNILTRSIKNCTVSIRSRYDRNEIMTFSIGIPHRTSYKINTYGARCIINVDTVLDIEFVGENLPGGYGSYSELYGYAQQVIRDKILDFMDSVSGELKADILNIGKTYRMRFLTWQSWEEANWERLYRNADFDIKLKFV